MKPKRKTTLKKKVKYKIFRSGNKSIKIPIRTRLKKKIKRTKPKVKDIMTLSEVEDLYKYELKTGKINTISTPHYQHLNQFSNMLRDMGIKLK